VTGREEETSGEEIGMGSRTFDLVIEKEKQTSDKVTERG